ncbi:MAG: trimethylamine methyltransferase, partial [Aliifodinibius sp.]|nr:trimethylamine methyltransferase [candidate division Zixibacteria bacterium]NIT55567.1 trimethylamine methyltransferase [Fodinibius sp.]NIW43817.1 trimethylamine methyltransferase [Gammaproteobacteria bacterium]NIR62948.1 trimethylamine methyltransferase [candidate division Zixibacteria bacterium]NIS44958.1 trimethylamine methyltransferase [candidate division Zixibacteria bacterium]
IYFDPEMVMEYIAKAPSQFTQISRKPERSVSIGGSHMVFAPVYGPPFVYDLQNGRRIATLEDFQNFVKLSYLSPYLHHSGGTVVEPNDIPVDVRHLHMLFAHIKYSDKPFMGSVTSPENARDSVELCKILYGEDRIRDNPALISLININSPRQFDDRMLGALRVYAQENQATIITPFVLAGAMAPVTIAGAIAQQNAEILAGIVYSQMINPGAPVVYGSFSTNMDFLSGSPVLGSPESQMIISISGQLARKYNLPYRSGGMFTSSKLTDAQAATESMMTMMPAINSHVNFVLHAAGWLDSGMVAGYEKFMLDCEVLGMLHKYLEGIDMSDEALA